MKNLLKTAICTMLIIAVIVPLTAVNASAAKPKISKTSADVPIGYSVTVKVTGASNVKWSSSDESVAAVKADGASAKITGKKTGSATISAKVGSTTLKCAVTVKKSFITPSTENVTVSKGKSKTITLKVSGSKDIAVSNSNKDVCSTSFGKWDGNTIKLTIKGKSNGSATIKVYTKKYSKSTTEKIVVKVGNGGNDSDDEIIGDDDIKESSDKEIDNEDKVVEIVNKERKKAGKDPLKSDDELNAIAALRAKEIAEQFSHTRPNGTSCFTAFDEAGYKYMMSAENIAYNYNDSADDIMEIWMNSSGHKANILSGDVTKIGVGLYESGGKYYWVQVFAG
ncbi:MAG: Ig-like domain-containing protein [Oscillospiraceae bacterium]|nr:Ig-like domain-containing protein [Oscillospiraceae bacterium]